MASAGVPMVCFPTPQHQINKPEFKVSHPSSRMEANDAVLMSAMLGTTSPAIAEAVAKTNTDFARRESPRTVLPNDVADSGSYKMGINSGEEGEKGEIAPFSGGVPGEDIAWRVGGYNLGEVLGEGTFGVVRKCLHVESGKEYAVKVVEKRVVRENKWIKKIRREIRIMKELDHQYVVALREVLNSSSKIYIVMELVRGGELYWRLQQDGGLEEPRARRYFQQLVDAVSYCHRKGVFHRDLKPENLLLCPEGDMLKITDFGLSAIKAEIGGSVTRTACGSPHYVPPEMSRAVGYDAAKIDSWSCGIILYLLLTGWLPFHDENPQVLHNQIQYGPVEYTEEIPPGACEIIAGLLEKDPTHRWSLSRVRKHPWFRVDYVPVLGNAPSPFVSAMEKGMDEVAAIRLRSQTIQTVQELASSPHVTKGSPFLKTVQRIMKNENKNYQYEDQFECVSEKGEGRFIGRDYSRRQSFIARFVRRGVPDKNDRLTFAGRIRASTLHIFRSKFQMPSRKNNSPPKESR